MLSNEDENACCQMESLPLLKDDVPTSESCLFLNVYVPATLEYEMYTNFERAVEHGGVYTHSARKEKLAVMI